MHAPSGQLVCRRWEVLATMMAFASHVPTTTSLRVVDLVPHVASAISAHLERSSEESKSSAILSGASPTTTGAGSVPPH
eukprot:824338-Amphidinium_carterae.1